MKDIVRQDEVIGEKLFFLEIESFHAVKSQITIIFTFVGFPMMEMTFRQNK